MSKVYDNGTMRTATAEEEQNINMNIGGGTSRFELVHDFEIDAPFTSKSFNLDGYDELVVEVIATGSVSQNMWMQIWSGTNNASVSVTNFFTTSERRELIRFFRLAPNLFEVGLTGQVQGLRDCKLNNIDNYKDKLTKVTIGITGANTIVSGRIKIYGRNIKE